MNAVDTNILVRALTGDHPQQTPAAKLVLASGPVWIAKTVLIETAWVLRSYYRFDDEAIRAAFVELLGLENLTCEDEAAVASAFELAAQGLQFADALHLSSRPAGARFVSFDRKLVQRAKRAGAPAVTPVH